MDDFILSLIRDPRFAESVNDIVVECGNVRYQSILDRYIAGEDVPFTEIQHVWRDTTQPMCGESGFFEQLYPLVRAINQHLLPRDDYESSRRTHLSIGPKFKLFRTSRLSSIGMEVLLP